MKQDHDEYISEITENLDKRMNESLNAIKKLEFFGTILLIKKKQAPIPDSYFKHPYFKYDDFKEPINEEDYGRTDIYGDKMERINNKIDDISKRIVSVQKFYSSLIKDLIKQ